jgi:hypothetical protein
MRTIPPDIWMMAVAVGKLQRAIDETKNSLLVRPMFEMQRKLNQFIYATRKDQQK